MRGILTCCVAAITLACLPERSAACTCVGVGYERSFSRATYVFAGRVVHRLAPDSSDLIRARGTVRYWSSGDMIRWTIVPTASWKGSTADTFFVYSEAGEATCGYGFTVGEEYIVHAVIRSVEWAKGRAYAGGAALPVMTTGLCSGNSPLARATEALAFLGPPVWERNEQ